MAMRQAGGDLKPSNASRLWRKQAISIPNPPDLSLALDKQAKHSISRKEMNVLFINLEEEMQCCAY